MPSASAAATGRRSSTAGLGLENTPVETDARGAIRIDDDFRTAEPSIHALGNVTGRIELTPVAIREAIVLIRNLFGTGGAQMSYENIPSAVFSLPSIGTVGLSEQQARERFANVKLFRSEFRPLKATLGGEDRVLIKLLIDADSDRVLGCHLLGDHAGEIIQGFAVAVQSGGVCYAAVREGGCVADLAIRKRLGHINQGGKGNGLKCTG